MNYYLYSHRQLYSVMANLDEVSLGFEFWRKNGFFYKSSKWWTKLKSTL